MQRRPFDAGWAKDIRPVGTIAWRAAVGPAVLLLTAIGIMALRIMSETSLAAALRAEAFFEAARAGDVAALQNAVEHDGMSVDLRETGSGLTPLMCAVNARRPAAVEWLLAHGADIDASVTAYGTPLAIVAASRDGSDMVAILLAHGADPNTCAHDGVTPLMQAAMWDNADAVDMLLRAGARPNVRSKTGNTARSIAASNGYERIVRMLDDAAAANARAGNPGHGRDAALR
jgi:ankyrin repeat protein